MGVFCELFGENRPRDIRSALYLLRFTFDCAAINSSPSGQNGSHFTDILKYIFMNEKFCILTQISLKVVP